TRGRWPLGPPRGYLPLAFRTVVDVSLNPRSRLRPIGDEFQSPLESNFIAYLQLIEKCPVFREADGTIIGVHRFIRGVTDRDPVGRVLQVGATSRLVSFRTHNSSSPHRASNRVVDFYVCTAAPYGFYQIARIQYHPCFCLQS